MSTDSVEVKKTDGTRINPAEEDGNLASIKTAVEKIDDWDDSDRAKTAQANRSTHWEKVLTAAGQIKAEENGKIVVLTDFVGSEVGAILSLLVREKNASGTIKLGLTHPDSTSLVLSFREGIEGASYDGSGAGDLYLSGTGISRVFLSGYMKDA